jgi:hypothetical protein
MTRAAHLRLREPQQSCERVDGVSAQSSRAAEAAAGGNWCVRVALRGGACAGTEHQRDISKKEAYFVERCRRPVYAAGWRDEFKIERLASVPA